MPPLLCLRMLSALSRCVLPALSIGSALPIVGTLIIRSALSVGNALPIVGSLT